MTCRASSVRNCGGGFARRPISDVLSRQSANLWSGLLRPVPDEMRALLAARWDSLPVELKTESQVLGRNLVHCSFTSGAAYCSFGCTHCYLPRNANRAPVPTLADMRGQIRANRRLIGPGGVCRLPGATWSTPTAGWAVRMNCVRRA